VLLGLTASLQAWLGWARTERALRSEQVLPGPSLSSVVTAGVGLGIVLVAIGLWW
jgi:putative membrane protein